MEKKQIYIAAAIIFIISLTAGVFVSSKKKDKDIQASPEASSSPSEMVASSSSDRSDLPQQHLVRRYLDGVYVPEGEENHYPVAVMIDNHLDARPASGIAKAGLVIEAEAEGGVTRYLAVFTTGEKIDEIGPVRSARPYYVDWAEELAAVYAHVGGSPEALDQIIADRVYDMNEFFRGSYFWRDHSRFAPHNVYTSTDKLHEYMDKLELSTSTYALWQFKDDAPLENLPATSSSLKINYLLKDFIVEWKYDRETNAYVRYLGGEPYRDKAGATIAAKNVVIQYASASVVDDKKRLDMTVIGKGKALLCQDGRCEEGTWKKKKKRERTKFYIGSEEFIFNAGQTWVNVIRPYYKVEMSDLSASSTKD